VAAKEFPAIDAERFSRTHCSQNCTNLHSVPERCPAAMGPELPSTMKEAESIMSDI
jgi:hypothetical protein